MDAFGIAHLNQGLDGACVMAAESPLDSLGVDIDRMEMMKQERTNPYNHFGKEFANEEDAG